MRANKIFAIAMAALALVGCKNNPENSSSDQDPQVTVKSITLDQEVLQIKKGETAELKATVDPKGAADVKWQSSDEKVATVIDGIVTAREVGTAYIVATADTKTARCKVTVYEEGETVITLDKTVAKIAVGETVTITASVTPAEKASELVWKSSNEAAATVAAGVVTGVAAGEAKITAEIGDVKAEATITVTGGDTPGGEEINHPSLKGSDYFIFQISDKAGNQIADKIVADFREDGDKKHFWIWPDEGDSYKAGETSGKNFYGEAEGWISLTVGTRGWSGGGYNCADVAELNKLAIIMDAPEDYYLHIAMKSTDNADHAIIMDGTSGKGAVCIGSNPYNDNGAVYPVAANFTRDGSWGEIEISMKTFIDQGLVLGSNNSAGRNVLSFLSGGQTGVMLQYDACFIYKKAQ